MDRVTLWRKLKKYEIEV
ncbi:hypothetical protein [Sulfurihydrogenibium azorense]